KASFGKRAPKQTASRNANLSHAPVLVIDARTVAEPIETAASSTPIAVSQGASLPVQNSNIRGPASEPNSVANPNNATPAHPALTSGSARYLPPGSAPPVFTTESAIVPVVLSPAGEASRAGMGAERRLAMAEIRQRDVGLSSERLTAEKEKE